MAINLDDIYGDGHSLVDPAQAAGGTFLQDEDEVRAVLGRLLSEPGPQSDMLRRMAFEDPLFEVPLHPSADLNDAAIADCLTDACMQGRVALVRTRKSGGGASTPPTGEDESALQDDAELPCDFEFMVIKCQHMPDTGDGKRTMAGVKYWKETGTSKNDLPTPRAERAGEKMIEVMAGSKEKDADEISIVLSGGPGYSCGKSHPHVKVTRGGQTVVEKKGETTVTFKAVAPSWSETASNGSLLAIMKRLWGGQGAQNVYTIDVASCGRNPGNEPGIHGRRQEKIRVYDKALYKLTIDIPALGKRSKSGGGGKYLAEQDGIETQYRDSSQTRAGKTVSQSDLTTRNADGSLERLESRSVTEEDGKRTTEARMRSANYSGGSSGSEDITPDPLAVRANSMVSFKREGEDLDVQPQLNDLVEGLVRFQQTVTDIKDFIRDFQPKVGWTFDFTADFFKGNLELEWGKKEWKDHTVYDYWKFSIGMTLFSLQVEAAFGIEFEVWWADVIAQVYGGASIDAAITAAKESSPESSEPWEASVKSEPKGELGVRAALGADWVKAEGKITVGMNFEAKCKVSTAEPFQIDWTVDRKKVEAILHGRIRWIGSFDRKWELWPEKKKWVSGLFPDR